MISSIAFLSGPLATMLSQSSSSSYSRLITTALILSLIGDYLLIPSKAEFSRLSPKLTRKLQASSQHSMSNQSIHQSNEISTSFKLGVVAFAAAHIAYISAFLEDAQEGISWVAFIYTFVATLAASRWLGVIYPNNTPTVSWKSGNVLRLSIPRDMKLLVTLYAAVIGSMFAIAVSTLSSRVRTPMQHPYQRILGATMFVISDIFVARGAFGPKPAKPFWPTTALGLGLYFWGQMILAGTVYG
ncbi:hypothetical protein FQN57_005997 [Myotisia sp. PD_48]|nr:hypothetical protein FQN57_005997 [Myotisia sp. PD_48]